jgi:hypothetical protein
LLVNDKGGAGRGDAAEEDGILKRHAISLAGGLRAINENKKKAPSDDQPC